MFESRVNPPSTGIELWIRCGCPDHYFQLRFEGFWTSNRNRFFYYLYVGHYEEIHEENELFHVGLRISSYFIIILVNKY